MYPDKVMSSKGLKLLLKIITEEANPLDCFQKMLPFNIVYSLLFLCEDTTTSNQWEVKKKKLIIKDYRWSPYSICQSEATTIKDLTDFCYFKGLQILFSVQGNSGPMVLHYGLH